jgi:crotonobetainyl-CoA:carnitine CoA-transferase CaiB-like acyl-CoA transferase
VKPLDGIRVVNLAVNIPGPVAAWRLARLGATVTKVEPPAGDPVAFVAPDWYRELVAGQEIVELDLKQAAGRAELEELLAVADLLLTSSRPSALARLGLAWGDLASRQPRLLQVAIVGNPAPDQDRAGHDLTYQAETGLAAPPHLPRTVVADLAGAERAATAAAALLVARAGGRGPRYLEVALSDGAADFAAPLRHGITTPDGVLGGGQAVYRYYEASDGWIAVAALEPHFRARLVAELGVAGEDADAIAARIREQTAAEWERWAVERDLPLVAVAPLAATPNAR